MRDRIVAMTTTSLLPQLGHYDIDAGRSTIDFATRHLFGLAAVRGSFGIRGGTLAVSEPVGASQLSVEIDAGSFHTGTPARDSQVRSANLLDTDRYPLIVFVAEGFDGEMLAGQLTVRDVGAPVSLTLEQLSADSESFTVRASTRIDRYTFGVTAWRGIAARHLNLSITAHCIRR